MCDMLDMKPHIFFHTVLNMINMESKNHNSILPTYKKALPITVIIWSLVHRHPQVWVSCGKVIELTIKSTKQTTT